MFVFFSTLRWIFIYSYCYIKILINQKRIILNSISQIQALTKNCNRMPVTYSARSSLSAALIIVRDLKYVSAQTAEWIIANEVLAEPLLPRENTNCTCIYAASARTLHTSLARASLTLLPLAFLLLFFSSFALPPFSSSSFILSHAHSALAINTRQVQPHG